MPEIGTPHGIRFDTPLCRCPVPPGTDNRNHGCCRSSSSSRRDSRFASPPGGPVSGRAGEPGAARSGDPGDFHYELYRQQLSVPDLTSNEKEYRTAQLQFRIIGGMLSGKAAFLHCNSLTSLRLGILFSIVSRLMFTSMPVTGNNSKVMFACSAQCRPVSTLECGDLSPLSSRA